jgi:hypothetical protein
MPNQVSLPTTRGLCHHVDEGTWCVVVISTRPLQKPDLRHDLRLDRDALFHFLGRQPLSASGVLLRKIHEWALSLSPGASRTSPAVVPSRIKPAEVDRTVGGYSADKLAQYAEGLPKPLSDSDLYRLDRKDKPLIDARYGRALAVAECIARRRHPGDLRSAAICFQKTQCPYPHRSGCWPTVLPSPDGDEETRNRSLADLLSDTPMGAQAPGRAMQNIALPGCGISAGAFRD